MGLKTINFQVNEIKTINFQVNEIINLVAIVLTTADNKYMFTLDAEI